MNRVAENDSRYFSEFTVANYDSLDFAVKYSNNQNSAELKEKLICEV